MSARLTPLTVAARQLKAWHEKRDRLAAQIAEIDDHMARWQTIYDGLLEEMPERPEVEEMSQ